MTEKMTFEQALASLQQIVRQIEKGDISLDDSLKLFKEGSELSAFCYKELNSAQQQITKINRETSNIMGE